MLQVGVRVPSKNSENAWKHLYFFYHISNFPSSRNILNRGGVPFLVSIPEIGTKCI
jgi:hypothetical protein